MATKKSYVIAGVVAVGLAGWLLSGQLGRDQADTSEGADVTDAGAATPPSAIETKTLSVRVRDLVAEPIEREIVINGKTEAVRSVEIRAETQGRVIELASEEGAPVDRGDVLVRLDPKDRDVQKLEAEALLRQRQIELDAARRLGEKGFQAETNVAEAEAYHAAAEAALKRAELALEDTVIQAPFAGILDRLHVEIGDYLDVGDPLALVLDNDPYLVVGDVTETEVGELETGMTGKIRLATGETVEGRLRYIASRADEQTRTFEVELDVPNPSGRLAAGVSAEIRLSLEQVPAHRVSPSVLTLADDGTLGVKTVDGDDVVVFVPATIAKADQNEVWLTGLPERVRLITVGQGFVSDGIEVNPMPVGKDGEAGDDGTVISEATQ